ncbi:hypothetical protein NDU88_002466 [Pleurodeles waltl]|uniref:Uncharacterized protein n=1 Tax=Pleurodeles waltl TaxID=8319 RepID=A0AAV7P6U9_PLEWA|nr:hypothetical protein NDU88_002466 [Pleurodeles waltl]
MMDQLQVQPHALLETILKELHKLKDMQQKEMIANNQRLDKIEEAMGQLPLCLQDLEQQSIGFGRQLLGLGQEDPEEAE